MKHRRGFAVSALCLSAGILFVSSLFAGSVDATGLVPTVWFDFETQPDVNGLSAANKGSASVSFKDEGSKAYGTGATGGSALDTSSWTPYTELGTFSTADGPFTISLVMNLGTTANGVALSVRNEAGQKDLVVRRGATAGLLVVGCGTWKAAANSQLETSLGNDSAWHLVSIVVEATGVSLYVDGDLASSMTDSTLLSTTGCASRFQFGSHLSGVQGDEVKGGGLIDDFRIHNAALTPVQMKAIAIEYGLVVVGDMLAIAGNPKDWGTVVPGYGVTNGLSQGDVIACSAVGSETETTKCCPIGHSLYSVASDGTRTLVEENAATSFTYTHGATGALLVWNWAHSNFVSVAAGAGGTVSAGDWVGYGDPFTVVATPYPGYKFHRWSGDTAGINVTSASFVLPDVTAPRSFSATFLDENIDETVQWVSPDGNDANDGYLGSAPKKTIAAAVAWLAPVAQSKHCTVCVTQGLYKISSPIVLADAISVRGVGSDPARVIVSNTIAGFNWGISSRCFELKNSAASISGLTLANGVSYGSGGNLYINSNGGTASNCVIRSGLAREANQGGAGANVCVSGPGLVTHCMIFGGMYDIGGDTGGSCSVFLDNAGARIENSLVDGYRDQISGGVRRAAGVTVNKGCAVNCTVVNCYTTATEGNSFSGIRVESNGSATNCVSVGNYDGAGTLRAFLSSSGALLVNCAYDQIDGKTEALSGMASPVVGALAGFFADHTNGDYRPSTKGMRPLVNKGQNYEGMAARDLGGNKRLIGSKIDIGCYEAPAAELCIRLR